MAWDFVTLYTELQNELDDTNSDTLTNLKQAINDTCQLLWHAEDWPFRQTSDYLSTSAGTRTYAESLLDPLPLKILTIGYKGSGESTFGVLNEIDHQSLLRQGPDITVRGRPFQFSVYAGLITLDPTPDFTGSDNLEVNYDQEFQLLVDDTDVPQIPERYKHVIKAGARWLFYDIDDDLRAGSEKGKFYEGLAEMRSAELNKTKTPRRGLIASHPGKGRR